MLNNSVSTKQYLVVYCVAVFALCLTTVRDCDNVTLCVTLDNMLCSWWCMNIRRHDWQLRLHADTDKVEVVRLESLF